MRVARDGVMQLAGDAEHREALAEGVGRGLAGVLREHHRRHGEPVGAVDVGEAQHVLVVGDAQVAAGLVLLDVVGVDGDDDLDVLGEALEHAELDVGGKAGQHARGVVVVEELAAELEVELAAELVNALADMLRLELDVLVVVKTNAHRGVLSCLWPRAQAPHGLVSAPHCATTRARPGTPIGPRARAPRSLRKMRAYAFCEFRSPVKRFRKNLNSHFA